MNHTQIWDELCKTDPSATKGFKRSGGFSGTAIKPIYSVQRMTKLFGPYGKGWGVDQPHFQLVNGENKEILVYCTILLWWMDGPTRKEGYGVGGDKVVTYIAPKPEFKRPERWDNDDEAFKKAFTDAMANAMKHLGMSADIHMGLFDDNKYVRQMEREFAEEEKRPVAQPPGTPEARQVTAPRGTQKASDAPASPPPPPAPTGTPPAAELPPRDQGDADWPIWLAGFKDEFLKQPHYLAAVEYWKDHQTIMETLREQRPDLYKPLVTWTKQVTDGLPKVGA